MTSLLARSAAVRSAPRTLASASPFPVRSPGSTGPVAPTTAPSSPLGLLVYDDPEPLVTQATLADIIG
ncbi:hypothetical protein [Nocardia sp. MW-W600-9]